MIDTILEFYTKDRPTRLVIYWCILLSSFSYGVVNNLVLERPLERVTHECVILAAGLAICLPFAYSVSRRRRQKGPGQWMESTRLATRFTPVHDRILVRRVEKVDTTRGGITLPDSAKDNPQEGEVISVGKGKTNDEGKVFPLAVQEGDRILFSKYAGTEIKIDGQDFLIMKEEEVLGVIFGAAQKETLATKRVGARK
jgi:chaperonin GroES